MDRSMDIGMQYIQPPVPGAGHFGAAVSAPPFGHHRLGAQRFGAGTSRRWDISAPAVTVPDISALALYAAAAAVATQCYAAILVDKGTQWKGQFGWPATRHLNAPSRSHGSVRVVRTTSKVNGKC